MIARRGAVLVESAFAVSLILIAVFGAIQLGLVGLEQLTVDGGAFSAAHEQALLGTNLKNYASGPTVAKAALPYLNSSHIKVPDPTLGQAPTTFYDGQYNPSITNSRHGGVSMIQPVQAVSFVTSTDFATLLLNTANSISVTGVAIDPAFRLINGHGDVSGNGFNDAASFATAADPLVNGNNAPPYFVGFNYMKQCPYSPTASKACPTREFIASLGLAEYLDVNNWGRPINGVLPDSRAVFYETRLHQNKFAEIGTKLAGYGMSVAGLANKANYLNVTVHGAPGCVYSFDYSSSGSYSVGTTVIGQFPLNPGGDPAFCN